MPELISSLSNPRIKQVRSLHTHKGRAEGGVFLVEGIHHVGEAAAAAQAGGPVMLEALYYAPDLLESEFARQLVEEQAGRGVPVFQTTRQVFLSIAEKDNPQGLLAVVRHTPVRIESLKPDNFPWGVALVSAQDPGNLGSILRTIDAVGASGLLLLEGSVDPYHPSAVRASMGALFWQPLARASFSEFIAWAHQHAYHIYGSSARGAVEYSSVHRYERPAILLLGSERAGLSPEQSAACDSLVRLPMHGRASSLNLAAAAAILMYDMLAKS